MNNKDWKDLHSGSSGAALVNMLVDEVELMIRARNNANGCPGNLVEYWAEEEKRHAERVAWLREKLYKKFEREPGKG